jgi:hypothetical protein
MSAWPMVELEWQGQVPVLPANHQTAKARAVLSRHGSEGSFTERADAMRGPFKTEQPLDFSIQENEQGMRKWIKKVGEKLGKEYPLVIGGEERYTGDWITSINPGNPDQVVGKVAKASRQDAEDAVKAAHKAFKKWRTMSARAAASE